MDVTSAAAMTLDTKATMDLKSVAPMTLDSKATYDLKSVGPMTFNSATGPLSMQALMGVKVNGMTGMITIMNSMKNLAVIFQTFLASVLENSTPAQPFTVGSPASHGLSPKMLKAFIMLQTDLLALLM
jgi:hypothetical protein